MISWENINIFDVKRLQLNVRNYLSVSYVTKLNFTLALRGLRSVILHMRPNPTKGTTFVHFESWSYCYLIKEATLTFKIRNILKLQFRNWILVDFFKSQGQRLPNWENGLRNHQSVLKIIYKLNMIIDFWTLRFLKF